MPAFVLNPISMFAEALLRCKSPGLQRMFVGFGARVRRNDSDGAGADVAEVDTMAQRLEHERWKRGDLPHSPALARRLWITFIPDGTAGSPRSRG